MSQPLIWTITNFPKSSHRQVPDIVFVNEKIRLTIYFPDWKQSDSGLCMPISQRLDQNATWIENDVNDWQPV